METEVTYTRESMEDSFVYKMFNSSNSIMSKMVENIKNSEVLTMEAFEDQYRQIKRSSVSPLSRAVLAAFDAGLIEIRYAPAANVRMPSPVPFIIRRGPNGSPIATIFIKAFSGMQNGMLNIPTKNLYAIMESAYLALQIQQYPTKLMRNTTVCKICMYIYTQMYMKILIKEYALSMDRPLCDKVKYCVSRFFLEKVWGLTNTDAIVSYAAAGCVNLPDTAVAEITQDYSDANIIDVQGLITFLANYSPRMKSLNTKYFIERWISMYHAPATLAIDYLPYLLFTINNVVLGSFIVAQNSLADVIKECPGMSHYYGELAKTFTM